MTDKGRSFASGGMPPGARDDSCTALIGNTGFVGGNLLRQQPFDALFNSKNIDDIAGRSFDLVVCAGVRAEKWLKLNADYAKTWPNITVKKAPPADSKEWEGKPNKLQYFSPNPGSGD